LPHQPFFRIKETSTTLLWLELAWTIRHPDRAVPYCNATLVRVLFEKNAILSEGGPDSLPEEIVRNLPYWSVAVRDIEVSAAV